MASTARCFPAARARPATQTISDCARSSSWSRSLRSRLQSHAATMLRRRAVSGARRGNAGKSRARPLVPACGRVPRNSASSSTSMARFSAPCAPPSRSSGCFSSASSVGGSSPFAAASAVSRAKMPAEVSISASPPESSNSRFQRPSAAITRRASARSGVTSAADFSDAAPRASRPRWPAPPSPDWAPRSRRGLACRPRSWRRSPAASAGHAIARSRSMAASSRRPAPRARSARDFPEFRRRRA